MYDIPKSLICNIFHTNNNFPFSDVYITEKCNYNFYIHYSLLWCRNKLTFHSVFFWYCKTNMCIMLHTHNSWDIACFIAITCVTNWKLAASKINSFLRFILHPDNNTYDNMFSNENQIFPYVLWVNYKV